MKRYKASIVIPAYNEELYLPRTLESIMRQSWQNFELIVVDAYSEDKTEAIAKEYGAKVVKAPKGNIGNSRKVGSAIANGNFIVSTSADVIHSKEWLEHLLSPLMNGAHASAGSICLQDAYIHEKVFTRALNKVIVPALFFLRFPQATADNIAIERGFYHKIGGFRPLPTAEEIDLLKRVIKNGGKLHYVEKARVYVSPRRLRAWGAWKYFTFHVKNFIKYNVKGEVASGDEYEPIR